MSNLSEIQIQEIKFLDELLDQVIILDKSKNICCANKSAHNRFGSKLEGKNISSILSCLLYTSPSPRDRTRSRMPSSA